MTTTGAGRAVTGTGRDMTTDGRDMTRLDLAELAGIVATQPYPLAFATVSGAHAYGFPSRDSDVDLRGVHLLPLDELVGLRTGPQTLDRSWVQDGMEVDLVTHEAAKFFGLLLRPNGYVLEQVISDLVVATSPVHTALLGMADRLVTRHHAHHYLGFATTQRRLLVRSGQLKPLLYCFRVLLTGINLMRTGQVVIKLPRLIGSGGGALVEAPGYLPELIEAKVAGEHDRLDNLPTAPSMDTMLDDVDRLSATLARAMDDSDLPDRCDAGDDLHRLLLTARLGS